MTLAFVLVEEFTCVEKELYVVSIEVTLKKREREESSEVTIKVCLIPKRSQFWGFT